MVRRLGLIHNDSKGRKVMTPEEDQSQTRKDTWMWIGISVIVIVIAILAAFGVGYLFHPQNAAPTSQSDTRFLRPIFQIIVCLSISGLGGWWIGRARRKILERKLGRGVYGDHELTSLTSWMEASRKTKSVREVKRHRTAWHGQSRLTTHSTGARTALLSCARLGFIGVECAPR